MTTITPTERKVSATKVDIRRAANGWAVKATLVYDAGDQVPWPYEHDFVFETGNAMLDQLCQWFGTTTYLQPDGGQPQ